MCRYNVGTREFNQLGKDIDGKAADGYSGESVSLSADGNIVAIGAVDNSENGDRSGHVRLYKYNDSNDDGEFNKLGSDINGDKADDMFGHSLLLSLDEYYEAIGGPTRPDSNSGSGYVRVFRYDDNGQFFQHGPDIDGDALC